jgi:ubiquitin carboxyl-terminal hydrolase 8
MKCSSCGHSSTTKAVFRSLSVDVPDDREAESDLTRVPLSTLLKNLISPETLDDDNRWECTGCKEKVCASKAQHIDSLPPVLAIHLKRFRFDPVSTLLYTHK